MDSERKLLLIIISSIVGIVSIIVLSLWFLKKEELDIPVGILNSLTGDMAITEKPMVQATLMAIEEINNAGGVLGRKIKPIVRDGKSDNQIFKHEATDLIVNNKVVALFGVWRSSTRAIVKDIVEHYDNVLFYPAYDEGIEESSHIVYVGSVANQGILPAISWCFHKLGNKFFIINAHDLFPRVSSEIARLHIQGLGGEIVGQAFLDKEEEIPTVVKSIIESKPAVIINTLDSPINIPFFKALRAANIRPENIPTMSFGFDENQLQRLDVPFMVGDYVIRTYFQSIYRPENVKFINNFKARYGASSVLSSNMQGAYASVYLWAQAVTDAKDPAPQVMRKHLPYQVLNAPAGIMYLDETYHTWRSVYIGRIQYNGQFAIMWSSGKPIRPLIYPPYKDKHYWQDFVRNIKTGEEYHG